MSTWLVETRTPPIPGAPREPWQHFAVAPARQRARDLATFPRAHGYETRVRKRNHEPAAELRLGMPRDVDRTSKLR